MGIFGAHFKSIFRQSFRRCTIVREGTRIIIILRHRNSSIGSGSSLIYICCKRRILKIAAPIETWFFNSLISAICFWKTRILNFAWQREKFPIAQHQQKNNYKKLCANSNELTKMSSSIDSIRLMMFFCDSMIELIRYRYNVWNVWHCYWVFEFTSQRAVSRHPARGIFYYTSNGEYGMNQGGCYNFHKFLYDYQNRWKWLLDRLQCPKYNDESSFAYSSLSLFVHLVSARVKVISIYVKITFTFQRTHTNTHPSTEPCKAQQRCVHHRWFIISAESQGKWISWALGSVSR